MARKAVVGAKYLALSRVFRERFPIGAAVTTAAFDEWGHKLGGDYTDDAIPDLGATSKQHPAWGTQVRNRHTLKDKINLGARCLELPQEERFQIVVEAKGTWRVQPMAQSALNTTKELPSRLKTIFDHKKHIVEVLIQSNEFGSLSVETQRLLRGCQREILYSAEGLDSQIRTLERRIKDTVAEATAELRALKQQGADTLALEQLLSVSPDTPALTHVATA